MSSLEYKILSQQRQKQKPLFKFAILQPSQFEIVKVLGQTFYPARCDTVGTIGSLESKYIIFTNFKMKGLYLLTAFLLLLLCTKAQRHSMAQHLSSSPDQDAVATGQLITARIMQQNAPKFPQTQSVPTFGAAQSAPELAFGTFQAVTNTGNVQYQQNNQGAQQQPVVTPTSKFGSTTESVQTVARKVAPNLQPAKLEPPKILLNNVGKPILGKSFKVDNGLSYQRLELKQIQKKYLFVDFKLGESDKWQQANLTITVEGTKDVIKTCIYDGYDSCYIPSSMLRPNQILFISVRCQDECRYMFNSRWSDLEHLIPGSQYSFKFGKETFQLYHVELQGIQFQQFRVHIAPRVTNRPFDNVKMYGKWGKNSNPTPEEYDFTSTNLWEDGEGLFLQSSKMKDKNFSLLLIGQTQTTYSLKCQLIKEANHQIQQGEHLYEYLSADESKSYHVQQFDTKKYKEFSLKVSVLSGYVEIRYFYDKDLKKEVPIQPFRYMDDSEYIFNSNQLGQLATNGLYLKATASADPSGQPARASTYTIKFQSRKEAEAVELNEHVYGFIPIQEAPRFAYFNFIRWIYETERSSNLVFTVSMIEVVGKSKPQFFLCQHANIDFCTNEDSYANYTQPINVVDEKLGEVRHYTLQISDETLRKINLVEKEGNLVVRMTTIEQDKSLPFNLVAVEMLNKNKVQYLRQDRPLQEKLAGGEMKLYKYINSDPKVKEIRIHVNQIAGIVKVDGIIKSEDAKQTIAVKPEGHTLRFTSNLTLPIILSVRAQTKSIFGISMQVILANQIHQNADIIAIGEDLAYTIRIQPQSYTVFEVTPMFYHFSFRYSSSQSVIACALSPQTGTCMNVEDKETLPRLSYEGVIKKVDLSAERRARVKITNPFSDSTAEVTVIFHSRVLQHCDKKIIGRVYSQTVKNGTCYSYLLQDEEKTGLEIYISKREFANMQYSVFICGNSISNAQTVKTITLPSELLTKYCAYANSTKEVTVLWNVNTSNAGIPDYSVKVDFVVQKIGGLTMLPEGLSYVVSGRAHDGILKVFGFSFINKINTRVYIRQNIGKFKAYAKVVKDQQREIDKISSNDYHFISYTTVDYSQDPVILISKDDISKGGCITCTLLIAVYSEDKPGRTVQFEVEVVQKYQTLYDDGSVTGYLQADSLAYYNYVAKEGDTTLIFFLSDHNERCANMFLSLTENPGPKNEISSVFQANQLVYHHKGPSLKYFLGVQAIRTCDYAISVLQVDSSIHRLERNKQNMLKLIKNDTRFFTFEHYTDEPFKIISLSKFGEVQLYLNKSQGTPDKKSWTVDELNVDSFELKSQHSNTLSVDKKDSTFCVNCDYFVAARATKTTFATIYLVYPQTVVPLLTNKFFSDYLKSANDKTLASYTRTDKTKLQIQVYSGQLEVNVVYGDKFKTSQTFKAQSSLQTMLIDIESVIQSSGKTGDNKKVDPYFDAMKADALGFKQHIPVNFIFKAVADSTSYTLEPVIVQDDKGVTGFATYQNIKAGQPNHLTVSNSKIICIDGYLRNSDQQILISTNSDSQHQLQSIIFDAKLRDNKTQVNSHFANNLLAVTLVDSRPSDVTPYGINNYQLCMKLDMKQKQTILTEEEKEELVKAFTLGGNTTGIEEFQDEDKEVELKVVVTQINAINLLPSDTDTTVHGNSTFLIHSDGQFVLDVFECRGDARVSYADSLDKLQSSKGKLLESVGISEQKHAVKVVQSDQTFINIKAEEALVRWLPINYETDEGTGYIKFAAGDLMYSSKFKNIRISFQPIQSIKKSKSKIQKVQYFLYISNNSESLDYASQCQTISNDVYSVPLHQIEFEVNKQTQKNYEEYDMDKNMLESQFNGSENIYINIVAKMQLTLSSKVSKDPKFSTSIADEHEHYTFIYNRQQMPLETYKPTQIQAIPYHFLLAIVLSIIVVLVLVTYLFTRKIAPMIARLRNSNLVEERDDPGARDDLEVVPPSSDRNQRASDLAVETEQKMK